MFDPDGDHAAADSTRSSTSRGTGSSVNPRTARRLVTASYTSMIAYLVIRYVSNCIIQYDFDRYYSRRITASGLRRMNRRTDARRQLSESHDIFTRIGV